MMFPMDVADGNTLVGHLNGTVLGGINMVAGVWGKALYIDGQPGFRVEYGIHTEGCFFDPDQCDQGITLSLWLRFQGRPSGFRMILNNGGCWPRGIGFCVYVVNDLMFFGIRRRSREDFYGFNINGYTDYQWHLVSFLNLNDDTKMYINGCKMSSKASYNNKPRGRPYDDNATFYIGDWSVDVAIDHLLVWYSVLTAEEMWNLYVQAGNV